MKYIKQLVIIMAVTCVGEFLNRQIPLPIPASVYGLVLMLVLLMTKVVRVEQVEETGNLLIDWMPMMFIAPAAGLIDAWPKLRGILFPLSVITVVSTVVVMVITGKVSDYLLQKKERKEV